MMQVRKGVVVATALASMAAGAVGAWIFIPTSGGAATTSTTNPSGGSNAGNGSQTWHSNEDPTHEKGESAQREAQENSGQFQGGGGGGGGFHSNEDPTHERSESAQREAQENSGQFPTP